MRTAIVALVTAVALVTSVTAQTRKVLVLPLDGNAPAGQKSQLNDSLAKIVREKATGEVTVGDTTFNETAAAVGCDPTTPPCADTLMATLGVDELYYGNASAAAGMTTVVVKRSSKDAAPSQASALIAETDSGDKAEPSLLGVFGETAAVGSAGGSGSAVPPKPKRTFFDTKERKIGVGLAAGGVIALAIGIRFWSSKSDLQDEIDSHPNMTLAELQDLAELEDRAASKALWGNVFVALGLGLGGAGAYFLYKDHKNRSETTLTPAPVETGTGMTFVLRGRW